MSDTSQAASPHPVAGSFRDPAGQLYRRDGVLLRQVDRSFAQTYDAVVASGCYDALHEQGLLVGHREVDLDRALDRERAHRVLRPRELRTISYPYEWAPGQLRDAALLTLRVQKVALEHGLALRDASAYNVQLERGRALFIDTLSFAPWSPGQPWDAYNQFCRHFLAPLALQAHVDVRLSGLLRSDLDGIPLDLASRLLPARTRLSPTLLTHLHLQGRSARREVDPDAPPRRAGLSQRAMQGLIDQLHAAVAKLTWDAGRTTWSEYYATADHYSDAAMADKQRQVESFLDALDVAADGGATVWDLGANTGRFAQLAADRGAHVVAFDIDHGAVEAAWRELRGSDRDVLPLVMDLTNPSPDLGWAERERDGLRRRAPADVVLALALVHHLAIGGNVPLDRVLGHLLELGRDVLVEWVPKDDPKVRVLLATREDVFADYRQEVFEAAAERHGRIISRTPVADSGRVLYHLRG